MRYFLFIFCVVNGNKKMEKWRDSGHSNFCYARYAQKVLTQIYRDMYRDAMLVPIRMGTTAGNQQKHLSLCFASKS